MRSEKNFINYHMYSVFSMFFSLYVKTKMHYISVMNDVLLPFKTH